MKLERLKQLVYDCRSLFDHYVRIDVHLNEEELDELNEDLYQKVTGEFEARNISLEKGKVRFNKVDVDERGEINIIEDVTNMIKITIDLEEISK